MANMTLTEEERAAFGQDITRNRGLDYFYCFDNVPLNFLYRDKVIPGELTDLERRNKAISETLWLDAYHQDLVCNVGYRYFYRGAVLQMVFQIQQFGAGTFSPPAAESRPLLPTAAEVQTRFDGWMASAGSKMVEDARKQPPGRGGWWSLVRNPDRTVRIASMVPVGNQVMLELISTWTQDNVLREAAWAVAAIYDADGTVLQDRSYIDLGNWPAARKLPPSTPASSKSKGVMDQFFDYHKSKQIPGTLSDLEKRNLTIVEGTWLDALNTGLDGSLDGKLFHPQRFRMQWPVQKCSCNLQVAKEVHAQVKEAAPDRRMRIGLTYAKGNQVVVEGMVSWKEDGFELEAPFASFLLLDQDGVILRDRCYLTLDNWPGAARMQTRLGL